MRAAVRLAQPQKNRAGIVLARFFIRPILFTEIGQAAAVRFIMIDNTADTLI